MKSSLLGALDHLEWSICQNHMFKNQIKNICILLKSMVKLVRAYLEMEIWDGTNSKSHSKMTLLTDGILKPALL